MGILFDAPYLTLLDSVFDNPVLNLRMMVTYLHSSRYCLRSKTDTL